MLYTFNKMKLKRSSALEDCDKALELDPTFVKAVIRKGQIQTFLKQYTLALKVC
jgi:hypothetical protein